MESKHTTSKYPPPMSGEWDTLSLKTSPNIFVIIASNKATKKKNSILRQHTEHSSFTDTL